MPARQAAMPPVGGGQAMRRGASINSYPPKAIKRVGYTDLGGQWDQFAVSRFVDLIEKSTGASLDASAVMRRYDADGDGLLSMDEQSAMLEGLAKAEIENADISKAAAESVIEQLKALSGREDGYAPALRAARRYERMFWFEGAEAAAGAASA